MTKDDTRPAGGTGDAGAGAVGPPTGDVPTAGSGPLPPHAEAGSLPPQADAGSLPPHADGATSGPPRSPGFDRRTTLLLSVCYAFSVTSIALNVATAPIVGLALAPRPALATIPVSLQVLGVMAASMPASLLMHRIGRRNGFLVGTTIGTFGAGAAVWAILTGSFVLFCVGTAAMGILNGFAQFYRFAAAEVAAPTVRARAISYVMAGGVLAGVLGPGLAAGTAGLTATRFVGSYAGVVALYAVVGMLLQFVRLPAIEEEVGARPPRPLGTIMRDARFVIAVVAAMVAYGVMSLLMTATPLSMRAAGHSFGASAFVIQGHVVAMFAPSFFTGRLIERFGPGRIMAAGIVSLSACVAVDLSGQSVAQYWTALVLLGIGWNLLFVAGTTVLTTAHRTSERAKVQGVNDVLVFGSAAAGSFLAGYLVEKVGWATINVAVLPALALAAGVLVAAGRVRTPVEPEGAPLVP